MRPVVQFDVDGVLADFRAAFTRRAKTMGLTDTVVSDKDRVAWDDYGDLDKKAVNAVWTEIKRDPTFWRNAPPLIDAAIFRWIGFLQDSADVYFATARIGVDAKMQTVQWLLANGVPYPTVVITGRKGDTAAALGATHAIDDKAGNAIYTGYAIDGASYIIDRPYNRFDHAVAGGRVRRVATVGEFLNDVTKEIT